MALVVKNPPAKAGDIEDVGSVSGLRRSPGGGHATHSSVLAWRIPWTEKPEGHSLLGHIGLDTIRRQHAHALGPADAGAVAQCCAM